MNSLAATLLLTLVALASGQNDGNECHCGMFMKYEGSEIQVHSLQSFNVDTCFLTPVCNTLCAAEFRGYTNNGDLNHQLDNGYTVGQETCILLAQQQITTVDHETLYGYARLCDAPWDYDGESTVNKLCCQESLYIPCE